MALAIDLVNALGVSCSSKAKVPHVHKELGMLLPQIAPDQTVEEVTLNEVLQRIKASKTVEVVEDKPMSADRSE